ncbi:MAG: hypothetical protein V1798_12400 [Pseudomonadota bacterium]
MRIFITCCNLSIFTAFFLLAATGSAQTQDNPTYVPPPYGAQPGVPPSGFAPAPVPAQPGAQPPATAPGAPYTDGSYFVPVQPSPGYDYFEEEDEGSSGAPAGSGGGGTHETKDSFRLVDRPTHDVCRKWGNSLLGPTTFPDRSRCEFELGRKVDQGYSSIDDMYDRIELFKLKKVIRGDLKDRSEARQYSVNFDSLRKALDDASHQGCACLTH